jgi:hypothetical protein
MSLHRSPEFAAVLLIAQEAFPFDLRVWNHIDDRRQEANFDLMLRDATFSAKERLMLEITASLWASSKHPTILGVVAERLGDEWLAVILRALAASRAASQRARSHLGTMER